MRFRNLFRRLRLCAAAPRRLAALLLLAGWQTAAAQVGTVLFTDNFNNVNNWTRSSTSDAGVNTVTSNSASNSLFIRDGATVTSNAINALVPAARLTVWIRRGSSGVTGSGTPDTGENLTVEYLNDAGVWTALETFLGGGTAWQIYTPSYTLPIDALHAGLSIRFRMEAAGDNDYWHVDDTVVTEIAAGVSPLAIGSCTTFESGFGNWTVVSGGGTAGTSTQTASSPSNSMYTRGGVVSVTANPTGLNVSTLLNLTMWVREGGAFSNAPEAGEDLVAEFWSSTGAWVTLGTFAAGGTAGDVFTPTYALPSTAMHRSFRLRFRQTGGSGTGDYWHVDDVCLTATAPTSYSFEESSWTGSAGQVEDDGPHGLDGTSFGSAATANTSPAIAGDPGSCRYGVFDGTDDYVEVPDNAALDILNELTVSAWIYMRSMPVDLHTIVSKDTNFEFHVDNAGQIYWWWNVANFRTTGFSIATNRWYHVAVTYRSGSQVIYVDGTSRATASNTGTLPQNDDSLFIGTDLDFLSRAFDGYIDEVRILPRYSTQAQVQALAAETHPCPAAAARFTINHDGFGINCVAETVTVNVVDSSTGTPLLNYNTAVRLDTQTTSGAWALVTGAGTLTDGTANDGIATYTWPLGQSQAVFTLSYPSGTVPMDVDVYQVSDSAIRDTDAEGALTFYPNGFTVTAAAVINPASISTFAVNQLAGTNFTLHLTAYGQTPADPVCGIIEEYTGVKSLKFWSTYANPATGGVNVTITELGTTRNAATTEAAATVPQNVDFVAGKADVVAKYKDVGQIRISMKDDSVTNPSQLPTGIRGGTGNFVVRPYDFLLTDIRNGAGTANPQAVDAAGGVFVAAGAPFRMTVTARDAELTAAPNYGRETPAETVRLTPQLTAPAGGALPAVASTVGFGAFSNGSATGTDFTWAEVGIIRLVPGVGDTSYLGAGDAAAATVSEQIGRFVPSHFTVALNAPTLSTGCTAGGFTYQGQAFGYSQVPIITATARAVGGTTTTNYRGTFFKLTTASQTGRTYTSAAGTLSTTGLPPAASDPVVTPTTPGLATLTFASGSGLSYTKGALQAPFPAVIQLAINVLDLDGVAAVGAGPLGNPVTFGSPGGIGFTAGPEIRYGRIRLATAVGSERVDLPVRMVAEHYASGAAGFVSNFNDTCTGGITLAFSGFTDNLAAGETCVRDSGAPGASTQGCAAIAPLPQRYAEPPLATAPGDFNLRLAAPAAPGNDNDGSVTITATVPAWLRYDWNTAVGGDEHPSGQATFGIFKGESRQIYIREIY